MNIFESILYGFVQGVAEYLPISSSAHLMLLPRFLGKADPGLSFDVFLHIGTLLSTLIYFRKEWIALLNPNEVISSLKSFKGMTLGNLVLSTIPAVLFGLLLKNQIETSLRGEWIVAAALAVGGILLFCFDRFSSVTLPLKNLSAKNALHIGFFQCLSLISGMSRSGSTMMGGRFLGLSREETARYSFMCSVPITAGAILMEGRHWGSDLTSGSSMVPMLIAGLSSFLFGMLTIHFLIGMVRKVSFLSFAIYRVLFAGLVYFLFVRS